MHLHKSYHYPIGTTYHINAASNAYMQPPGPIPRPNHYAETNPTVWFLHHNPVTIIVHNSLILSPPPAIVMCTLFVLQVVIRCSGELGMRLGARSIVLKCWNWTEDLVQYSILKQRDASTQGFETLVRNSVFSSLPCPCSCFYDTSESHLGQTLFESAQWWPTLEWEQCNPGQWMAVDHQRSYSSVSAAITSTDLCR